MTLQKFTEIQGNFYVWMRSISITLVDLVSLFLVFIIAAGNSFRCVLHYVHMSLVSFSFYNAKI